VAVLEHSQRSSERLRAALTPPVIAALENEMLLSTATTQLEELRSARRLVVARGDQTRRRLERDLHDGAQQRLLALGLHLGRLAERAEGPERLDLGAAVDHAACALVNLRHLAHGAVPPLLEEAGLHEALTSLAEETPVALVLDIDAIAARRFDAELELAAHRLIAGSAVDAFNAGAPDLIVSATLTPVLTIRTQYPSDRHRARIDDEDRVGAAGGQLVSTHNAGVVIHEARFE
jgi:signal transduction histidine kinase